MKKSRIVLRLLNADNIEFCRELRNKFSNNFYTQDHITKEQQKAWYDKYVENYGRDFMWVIYLKSGPPIGTICLYNIHPGDRVAELGRMLLDTEYRGQGYMEEAIGAVLDIAFQKLRLYKLRLTTHIDNTAAISLYHKCGFESVTRPILLMEATNRNYNANAPITMELTDEVEGNADVVPME